MCVCSYIGKGRVTNPELCQRAIIIAHKSTHRQAQKRAFQKLTIARSLARLLIIAKSCLKFEEKKSCVCGVHGSGV
jgi:hypothetical protein